MWTGTLVYRGDEPRSPVQWSIRAGECTYNLRSGLDHLVWQLVNVNGECPGRHNGFPIQNKPNPDNLRKQLRGVSPSAVARIESVQPYCKSDETHPPDVERVGRGLAILDEIRNIDTHRHLAIANARWTGGPPKRRKLTEFETSGYVSNIGDGKPMELQHGKTIAITNGFKTWQYLEFPVDAFFCGLRNARGLDNRALPVGQTLDACIDSVEMVVSRFRREFVG